MTTLLPDIVQRYKALAHPARVRIVAMLRDGELCACQITAVLDLAASTVSAHLAELRRAGFLVERKQGRWVHYSLSEGCAAAGISEMFWNQVNNDPQFVGDAAVVRQLREIPVGDLCNAELDLTRLYISRT